MIDRHPYDLGWPDIRGQFPDDYPGYEEPEPLTEAQIAEDMIHAAQERDFEMGCYD